MSEWTERPVVFAGSAVRVLTRGRRAAELAEFLFGRTPREGEGAPAGEFRLDEDEDGRLRLMHGDERLGAGRPEAALAELLLGEVCHALAEQSSGGLLFHAAELAWRGQAIVLAGGIGAGKTTLTAWLATRGLEYVTDEMVYVPAGAERMQGLTRPLNLKAASRPVLEGVVDWRGRGLNSARASLLPVEALGGAAEVGPLGLPLGLILFPRYRPGAGPAVEQLSPARAGMRLMEHLVNARNLPDHGFAEAARLARLAPGWRAEYPGFAEVEAELERVLATVG